MMAITTVPEDTKPPPLLPDTQDAPRAEIPVILPDMFVSFLAQKPKVNPHYEKVRMESEAWINEFVHYFCERITRTLIEKSRKCDFDERMKKRIFKTNFSFFCSISAPEAGPEELRTICDWGNWVEFPSTPKPCSTVELFH